MNWKERFKVTLRARLIIISCILALVGWFLLGVVLFGRYYAEELLEIERLIQSTTFLWSFRIAIIAFTAILIWKYRWLDRAWAQTSFRYSLYFFSGIGLIGWVAGLSSLAV